ncbi:hypothetical protein D1007_36107 [Hordeum vulgare]|nr:hypothetical protein D1007_36107 [Hordeum vulgare]KAI4980097.1 hypothetical protein ZWY2020_016850 [Hordeum vulgare]
MLLRRLESGRLRHQRHLLVPSVAASPPWLALHAAPPLSWVRLAAIPLPLLRLRAVPAKTSLVLFRLARLTSTPPPASPLAGTVCTPHGRFSCRFASARQPRPGSSSRPPRPLPL